ncbi:HAD family phosphatase [Paenibacillus sp. SYP-B3998]|uniref:HAD family phosphatase n=1 Tax=Paenibacillus sp. SYP-B3998 TaxID=2678564 RepID=A0A6G3ZXF3_9BACL|nr:HAD family phosphatase [Paenibacillus sp. SYP-B3998]
MYTAFIFDMDGVIIDSEPLHFEVDLDVMKNLGLLISKEELEDYVGMTNPEMWSRLKDKYAFNPSVAEIIDVQLAKKLSHLNESNERPIEGIMALIQLLKLTNKKIGLASSSPRTFIEAVLTKFNILTFFDCILSGEEVSRGKPAPDIYVKIAEMLETGVGSCIVLEDSRNGIAAAKAAGMKCIGFKNLNSGLQDLSKADYVVERITEINSELLESL